MELAPLCTGLALKNAIDSMKKPATQTDPHAFATALAREKALAAAQHAIAAEEDK